MHRHYVRNILMVLLAVALLLAVHPAYAQGASRSPNAQAMAAYRAKLEQYLRARATYDHAADAYWNTVSAKRKQRNIKRRDHIAIKLDDYVLTQPPTYTGPRRPINPAGPGPLPGEREKPRIPVVADLLDAAREQFGFVPVRVSEIEFKRAYARAAQAAGLTRDQIVGVYAFETGGNGTYESQPGISATRQNPISPAVGYNQLLSTNSVSLFAEHGNRILAALHQKAKVRSGSAKLALERKIAAVKRMIAYTHTVPQRWSDFDRLAKTTAGGWGIHAAVLDIDIGPLLQVEKLMDSVRFAHLKGLTRPLSAAELELMNLTGDGNGFDMVTMPQAFRDHVPTANFFQQNGYARNPVARRTAVVAGLIAEIQSHIDRAGRSQGARDLAEAYQPSDNPR
jgi:hypothetical protein